MTEKELRRLSRKDLLQILLEQSLELQQLSEQLEDVKKQLEDTKHQLRGQTVKISQAGSLADVAMQVSGLMEAAQKTCKVYTDNIVRLSERQERICANAEEESRKKAELLIAEAKQERDRILQEAREEAERIRAEAGRERE